MTDLAELARFTAELPFPLGYHIEMRGGRIMPDMRIGGQLGGEMLTTGPALRAPCSSSAAAR